MHLTLDLDMSFWIAVASIALTIGCVRIITTWLAIRPVEKDRTNV